MSLGTAYFTLFGTMGIILAVTFIIDWYEKYKGKKGN